MPEHDVKLVFLYNFMRFAQWPAAAWPENTEYLDIGVLDSTPFARSLHLLKDKVAQGCFVRVKPCRNIEDASRCQVVFLNSDDDLLVKAMLQGLRNKPVLTVGENASFIRWGAVSSAFTSATTRCASPSIRQRPAAPGCA